MARDVFGREARFGGAFSADGTRLTFADAFNCGMMVQQISYNYMQNLARIYEVGCPDVYLVAGRTQGSASISRIWGPKRLAATFYQQFGDACQALKNNIRFSAKAGCGANSVGVEQAISLKHAVIQQIQGSVTAQDMLINDSMSLMFLIMLMQ